MMVAVAVWCSPPPQHSPMLGHLASSHTWGGGGVRRGGERSRGGEGKGE